MISFISFMSLIHCLVASSDSSTSLLHSMRSNGILVHKFVDDDARPLQQGSGLLRLLHPSGDLLPQQVALGPELRIALP